MNAYRVVPNPLPEGHPWAIEWLLDGLLAGHIRETFDTKDEVQRRADALGQAEATEGTCC